MCPPPTKTFAEASYVYSTSGVFRISKGGGANVCWALVLTQMGAKPSFSILLLCRKKFLAKDHGRFGKGVNTPLASNSYYSYTRRVPLYNLCRHES